MIKIKTKYDIENDEFKLKKCDLTNTSLYEVMSLLGFLLNRLKENTKYSEKQLIDEIKRVAKLMEEIDNER